MVSKYIGGETVKNGMARQIWRGVAVLAALAVVLVLTACAPATDIEERAVEFTSILPITGAAGAEVQVTHLGCSDYVSYFNEEEAIPGVRIKYTWSDTGRQLFLFLSQYEKACDRGVPVMFTLEADGLRVLNDRFAKDEIVALADGGGFEDVMYSPGWRYCQGPSTAEQFALVADHLMENWNEPRPPRLAFVVVDIEWGREVLVEGTKYAQSLGFEILPTEIVGVVILDATTQLVRLREEKADIVYLQALPSSGTGPILRDAERLGLLSEMQFIGTETGMGDKLIGMTGTASEGFLMAMITPWFEETEVPGVRLMLDSQMKYRGKVEREIGYRNGFVVAAVACEAIKQAVDNVGYENVDGAAIKEALDNMEDFDVHGLASITYKDRPFDHRGITQAAVHQVQDGKIVRLSDWQELAKLWTER
jgi:branched-chain amino acid transport system substrate-binding protein